MVMSILITLSLCSIANAESLNNEEYINKLNTNLAEMRLETDIKGGSFAKLLVSGIDDGYLKPEIIKLEKFRESLNGLILNMENIVIENKELESKHNEFITSAKNIVKLLDKDINVKKELLNSNANSLIKISKLLKIDNNQSKEVNDYIEKANAIHKEINQKFKLPKYGSFLLFKSHVKITCTI